MKLVLLALSIVTARAGPVVWTWWVAPCTAELSATSGCEAADPELAGWALNAWARESAGGLRFVRVKQPAQARIQLRWVQGSRGLYGETRGIPFENGTGAEVFVLARMDALGPEIAEAARKDKLLRDSIVYLTCLHESGHALGLAHTNRFDDIMYSFQYGGDIPGYFVRFRRKLTAREDIRRTLGVSANDREALAAIMKAR